MCYLYVMSSYLKSSRTTSVITTEAEGNMNVCMEYCFHQSNSLWNILIQTVKVNLMGAREVNHLSRFHPPCGEMNVSNITGHCPKVADIILSGVVDPLTDWHAENSSQQMAELPSGLSFLFMVLITFSFICCETAPLTSLRLTEKKLSQLVEKVNYSRCWHIPGHHFYSLQHILGLKLYSEVECSRMCSSSFFLL